MTDDQWKSFLKTLKRAALMIVQWIDTELKIEHRCNVCGALVIKK